MTRSTTDAGKGSLLFTLWMAIALAVHFAALWVVVRWTRDGSAVRRRVRAFARSLVSISGCELRVSGVDCLRDHACAVLVANHSSFADSIVVMAAVPCDFRFVANHRAAGRPVVGLVLKKAGHLIVNRDSLRARAECGRAMVEMLRAGQSLLVFPEGTAKAGPAMLPFRNGAFRAAARAGRPVIPIAISGTRRILPRSFRLLRRGAIDVRILPPLIPRDDTRETAKRLRDAAARAIAAALSSDPAPL